MSFPVFSAIVFMALAVTLSACAQTQGMSTTYQAKLPVAGELIFTDK